MWQLWNRISPRTGICRNTVVYVRPTLTTVTTPSMLYGACALQTRCLYNFAYYRSTLANFRRINEQHSAVWQPQKLSFPDATSVWQWTVWHGFYLVSVGLLYASVVVLHQELLLWSASFSPVGDLFLFGDWSDRSTRTEFLFNDLLFGEVI